jgi:hypothetical protein
MRGIDQLSGSDFTDWRAGTAPSAIDACVDLTCVQPKQARTCRRISGVH